VTSVHAHEFAFTQTRIQFKEGRFQIDLTCDVDALALGVPSDRDSAANVADLTALSTEELQSVIQKLRGWLNRTVRAEFDEQRASLSAEFPDFTGTPVTIGGLPSLLGVTARLSGEVPPDARNFTFRLSRAFPPAQVTISREGQPGEVRHLLGPSDPSPPYPLTGPPPPPPTAGQVARDYLRLGFLHILPRGLDHVLFVLGLFLLSNRWGPLIWQVSAFTLAHTITLALSMLGVVSLPPSVVEPLIALSIAYVAVENIATTKMQPWRPAVVFGFGLLHGMGFAGVLRDLSLPEGQFIPALLAFNVGVEVGQLTVIGLAWALVGWARSSPRYRPLVVVPASGMIAAMGLYWTIDRIFM